MKIAYKTKRGIFYYGLIENAFNSKKLVSYKGKVNLILTSPPFPLNRKKKYGNRQGKEYIEWLSKLAAKFSELITEDGSIVIEIGNSWNKGEPTMSTLALEALLAFKEKGNLYLCQQFVWNNPAKLPTPTQWVNIKRNRLKDSFTNIWWLSKSPYPKADNKKVLLEYSESMKRLIKTKRYNSGIRPSEHSIGKASFLNDNRGAIPSNVLTYANTQSGSDYQKYCLSKNIKPHPARMVPQISEFFIKLLTDENDLVFDPFGGSNTTGYSAEKLNRNWISVEPNLNYIIGSIGRFENLSRVKRSKIIDN